MDDSAGAVDFEAIRRCARRRVSDPSLWEDVAQTACMLSLTQRRTRPALYVLDALRLLLGRTGSPSRAIRRPGWLEHPDWVASHYPTLEALDERWQDEESEDQADEWSWMESGERSRRVRESRRALGCSS